MLLTIKVKLLSILKAILVGLALLVCNPVAYATEPHLVVERFHGVLLSVMKSASTSKTIERYSILEPAIEKAFNLPFMMRIIAGSRWKKASQKEKKDLVVAFKRMSVATYASRFDGYSGQTFRTEKVRAGPKRTRLVDTLLNSPKCKSVKLTYVMRKFNGEWKVIDLLLDKGISEMAVRVSEYRGILRSMGAGALARALQKMTAKLLRN